MYNATILKGPFVGWNNGTRIVYTHAHIISKVDGSVDHYELCDCRVGNRGV